MSLTCNSALTTVELSAIGSRSRKGGHSSARAPLAPDELFLSSVWTEAPAGLTLEFRVLLQLVNRVLDVVQFGGQRGLSVVQPPVVVVRAQFLRDEIKQELRIELADLLPELFRKVEPDPADDEFLFILAEGDLLH